MKKQNNNIWQNRIVEHGTAPANQFLAHELNARRHPGHQRDALRGSLNEVGWIAPVIVSAKTGKLLDGHARIEEALTHNENAEVPFIRVDVSEAEERLILASFDPITGLAKYDESVLNSLLSDITTSNEALLSVINDLQWHIDTEIINEAPDGRSNIKSEDKIIKAVFSVSQLAIVEEAIKQTNMRNRSEALIFICNSFLSQNEKG